VLGERPVSLYEVPAGVAIWEKLEQPVPWQRSTRYWVTATLSVEAFQVRFTWEEEGEEAESPEGAVGGEVSGGGGDCVVAFAVLEYPERLLKASAARTR
jgi:hypothetical protein